MLDIIRNNYLVFTIISVMLIFSLIGYIADHHFKKDVTISDIKKEKEKIKHKKENENDKKIDTL